MDLLNGSSNLTKNMSELYASGSLSDVTLVVDGTKFKAHKMILAGQSPYFKALFYGNLKEATQKEIELKEISVKAFEAVLKYLYGVPLSLGDYMKDEEIMELLKLSQIYVLTRMEDRVIDYLIDNISIENFFMIFDVAHNFSPQRESLMKSCYRFLDVNAAKVLQDNKFSKLAANQVRQIILHATYKTKEIIKFQGIKDWLTSNPDSDQKQHLLKLVKLNLMTSTELLHIVRPSRLFSAEEILDVVTVKHDNLNRPPVLFKPPNSEPEFSSSSRNEFIAQIRLRYCLRKRLINEG